MVERDDANRAELQGLNTAMTIRRMASTVVLVTISGNDAGELGDAMLAVQPR